jgi:hypothetical protein
MKNFWIAAMFCLLALSMACSSPMTFDYLYNKESDFTKLKTYDWMPIPQNVPVREQVVQNVKSAANKQLEAKGFVVKPEQPDFLIAMHGQRETKTEVINWGETYSRSELYYYGLSSREVFTSIEGTLTLDVIDATTKKMVWQGTASSALRPDPTPQQQEKTLNKAVEGMLKYFPPERKKQ